MTLRYELIVLPALLIATGCDPVTIEMRRPGGAGGMSPFAGAAGAAGMEEEDEEDEEDGGNVPGPIGGAGSAGGVPVAPRCGDRQIDVARGEVCDDGNDADCDGCKGDCSATETAIDYYADADMDGVGAMTPVRSYCPIAGALTSGGDCNDGDPRVKPGAFELCSDNIDQDCQGGDRPCGEALLVVSEAMPLPIQDYPISQRLQMLGYTVLPVAATLLTSTNALGKTVVVVSESVSSGDVANKLTDVPVPVVTWEPALWDDLGMSAAAGTGTPNLDTLDLVLPNHPLAAGKAGPVTVFTTPQNLGIAADVSDAATVVGRSNGSPALFAYERGAMMPGLAAPARRVGFFIGGGAGDDLSADGYALFDAAVHWAAGNLPPTM